MWKEWGWCLRWTDLWSCLHCLSNVFLHSFFLSSENFVDSAPATPPKTPATNYAPATSAPTYAPATREIELIPTFPPRKLSGYSFSSPMSFFLWQPLYSPVHSVYVRYPPTANMSCSSLPLA